MISHSPEILLAEQNSEYCFSMQCWASEPLKLEVTVRSDEKNLLMKSSTIFPHTKEELSFFSGELLHKVKRILSIQANIRFLSLFILLHSRRIVDGLETITFFWQINISSLSEKNPFNDNKKLLFYLNFCINCKDFFLSSSERLFNFVCWRRWSEFKRICFTFQRISFQPSSSLHSFSRQSCRSS